MGVIQEIEFAISEASRADVIARATEIGDDMGARFVAGLDSATPGMESAARAIGNIMQREMEEAATEIQARMSSGLIDEEGFAREMAGAADKAKETGIAALIPLEEQGRLTGEQFVVMAQQLGGVVDSTPAVAAARAEVSRLDEEAEKASNSLGNMLGSMKKWLIGLASLAALKGFLKGAFDEFGEGELASNRLDMALRMNGMSADELRNRITNLTEANRALSVSQTETQQILGELTLRTSDIRGAFEGTTRVVNLMRFAQLDAAAATRIVAVAMNGSLLRVKQYGFESKNAADFLVELDRKSVDAADTFQKSWAGKVATVSMHWHEFKEAVGAALATAGGGTSIMDSVAAALLRLRRWVEENKEGIAGFGAGVGHLVMQLGRLAKFIVNDIAQGWREMKDGMAGARRDFELFEQSWAHGIGRMIEKFGEFIQKISFGRLGGNIVEFGRDMQKIADDQIADIEARYQRELSKPRARRAAGADEKLPTRRVRPPSDADAKKAREQLDADRDAALKMLEVYGQEADAKAVLARVTAAYRAELERGNLTYSRRMELITGLTTIEDALSARRARMSDLEAAIALRHEDEAGALAVLRAAEAELEAQLLRSNIPLAKQLEIRQQLFAIRAAMEALPPPPPRADPEAKPEDRITGLGDTVALVLADMENNSADVANSIYENFSIAFQRMGEEGVTLGSILSNLGKGMAASILGEIAKVAKGEAMMALANAIKFTAIGIGYSATGNAAGAGKAFAAAATHAKSALAWGALAGAMGGLGGGGGGSGRGGGGGAGAGLSDRESVTDRNRGGGSELHIHLDGVDPLNPRHQVLIGEAQRQFKETTGGKITVHTRGGTA